MDSIYALLACINLEARFPARVFKSEFTRFFFFDSDWVFDKAFIAAVRRASSPVESENVWIVNLDRISPTGILNQNALQDSIAIPINGLPGGEVSDGNIPISWITLCDRVALIPEQMCWCVYGERRNEIGVVAFRDNVDVQNWLELLKLVHAEEIAGALAKEISYGFSKRALITEWRYRLIQEYS